MPDPNLEIVTVFESDDQVAFELAKTALEEAGIEYATSEEALTGFGFSPIINPVRKIQIPANRKAEALELIQGTQQPADSGATENDQPAE